MKTNFLFIHLLLIVTIFASCEEDMVHKGTTIKIVNETGEHYDMFDLENALRAELESRNFTVKTDGLATYSIILQNYSSYRTTIKESPEEVCWGKTFNLNVQRIYYEAVVTSSSGNELHFIDFEYISGEHLKERLIGGLGCKRYKVEQGTFHSFLPEDQINSDAWRIAWLTTMSINGDI